MTLEEINAPCIDGFKCGNTGIVDLPLRGAIPFYCDCPIGRELEKLEEEVI